MIDDRELEQAARRLGEPAAARVDARRTGQAVIERLRMARAAPWWAGPGWLRAAALVILGVGIAVYVRSGYRDGPRIAAAPPVELQHLSEDELNQVMDSLVIEGRSPAFVGAALSDLSERELAQLLASMEG